MAILAAEGVTGFEAGSPDSPVFWGQGNQFDANLYYLQPGGPRFTWNNLVIDEPEWRASGQDVSGSFHYW
jgi:hypothetical protein